MANQLATTERTNLQTKRCSKDEAAALRKNHVTGRVNYGKMLHPKDAAKTAQPSMGNH